MPAVENRVSFSQRFICLPLTKISRCDFTNHSRYFDKSEEGRSAWLVELMVEAVPVAILVAG